MLYHLTFTVDDDFFAVLQFGCATTMTNVRTEEHVVKIYQITHSLVTVHRALQAITVILVRFHTTLLHTKNQYHGRTGFRENGNMHFVHTMMDFGHDLIVTRW